MTDIVPSSIVPPEPASMPIGVKFAWMKRAMDKAIEQASALTDFEVKFAHDTAARLRTFGAGTRFTAKQMGVAQRIGRKLEVEL